MPNGSIWELAKDEVKAERFFSLACELNDVESCNRLQSIKYIETLVDFNIAIKACSHGGKVGCYKLGELYASRNGIVKMDERKALIYFQKGCDLGQSQSCKRVGDFHRNGDRF